MYKTIRHGENSLQYTILPQNDDFRSNPADIVNQNLRTNRRCGNNKNGRRQSLLAYIGLFFICSVVTGAILIPLLVTTDLMESPTSWFFKAQKSHNPANIKVSINYIDDGKNLNNLNNNNKLNKNNLNNNLNGTNNIINNLQNQTDVNHIIGSIIGGGGSENNTIGHLLLSDGQIETSSVNSYDNITQQQQQQQIIITSNLIQTALLSTTTTKTITTEQSVQQLPSSAVLSDDNQSSSSNEQTLKNLVIPTIKSLLNSMDILTTIKNFNNNNNNVPATIDTIIQPKNPSKPKILFQEIIHKNLTKILLPTDGIDKNTNNNNNNNNINNKNNNNNIQLNNNNNIDNNNNVVTTNIIVDKTIDNKNWIKSHWPFVDPSTYFQWAGYDSEDSIILPAILCAALIIIFLLLTLCILARNKKFFVNSIWIRKRPRDPFGRIANETQEEGEDNTTLLANENASEEE